MRLEKRKNHTIEAIVDRIILKPLPPRQHHRRTRQRRTQVRHPPPRNLRRSKPSRWPTASSSSASRTPQPAAQDETLYSSSMACPDCGINVPRLEPRSFSFNSTYGACPECHGLGSIYDFDPAKTITDWSKPLLDGAMGPGSASAVPPAPHQARRRKVQDRHPQALRSTHHRAAEPLPLRPATQRGRPHRLPRHLQLPPRQPRRHQIRGLPRVHDAVHVRDHLPRLQRPPSPPGIPRRHHPHPFIFRK